MRDGRVNRLASTARGRSQDLATGAKTRSQGLATGARKRAQRSASRLDVPWARYGSARAVREFTVCCVLGPLMSVYTRRRTVGLEHLEQLEGPMVFVPNHASHMDTPMILRLLPRRFRSKVAVAAAADYFYRNRWVARGVSLIFSTVPLSRNGGGMDSEATSHVDNLLADGWSLIVYAEGTRSRDGRVGRLRSGAAVLAAEHGLPIVPVHITGTRAAMPPGQAWPKLRLGKPRLKVTVTFGEPILPGPDEHRSEVMDKVRDFLVANGAVCKPGKVTVRSGVTAPVAAAAADDEPLSTAA